MEVVPSSKSWSIPITSRKRQDRAYMCRDGCLLSILLGASSFAEMKDCVSVPARQNVEHLCNRHDVHIGMR